MHGDIDGISLSVLIFEDHSRGKPIVCELQSWYVVGCGLVMLGVGKVGNGELVLSVWGVRKIVVRGGRIAQEKKTIEEKTNLQLGLKISDIPHLGGLQPFV